MLLVIAEQRGGKLNRATWEAIAAAQQLAAGDAVAVLVPGASVASVARELAAAQAKEIVTIENPALEPYTPDAYTEALQQAIAQLSPSVVWRAYTLQPRDFDPTLAAPLGR